MPVIPHSRPTISSQDIACVVKALKSGQVSAGPQVEAFEKEFCRTFRVKEACAVASGTAALHLALAGLRVGPGDEVILPTFVCTALLNAVHYVGATPVLADVCYKDGNIDPKDVSRRITPRTKAMLVPHMFGFPADMKALLKFKIPIVEDCAQAVGARIGKAHVGSIGHAGVFSFYATKMMVAGEGGMLVSSDKALMTEARDLMCYDHKPEYRLRFNYKLTDIQAA
ncbi:MAG: DegT/DnrJ/EryC1/StrS aminotransferase family protein, partial [Candidatus Omnitrophica bacterium]|nr:DegT/DnrJ/EryC1/StrS aminotransferase family protein [Candidatus Omnitrophota bacterium]